MLLSDSKFITEMSLALQSKHFAATIFNKTLPLNFIFKHSKKRYIFAYHRVVPHAKALKLHMQKSMWISPETFSGDIDWMLKHGDIVDLDMILDFKFQNTKPLFSITFDDGWADNYETAYPILKSYSIPATIFLVSNAINTGNIFWVEDFLYKISIAQNNKGSADILHKLKNCANKYNLHLFKESDNILSFAEAFVEQLKPIEHSLRTTILQDTYKALKLDLDPIKEEVLNWDQIIEMYNNHITFGSHTHTHEILQYSSDKSTINELKLSKTIISEKIKEKIKYFCYPNARYNAASSDLIKEAGYSHAFRIHNLALTAKTNPYLVPRFLLNEAVCKNKNYLMCKLLKFPKFL